jgi:DNA helicase MCM9
MLTLRPESHCLFALSACPNRDFWAAHADCPLKGRNKILASICPQMYGLFSVKLAVALQCVGGVPLTDDGGSHIRGDIHVLLVGDPGTGKSQVSLLAGGYESQCIRHSHCY